MTKRNVTITISTSRIEVPEDLFDESSTPAVPFDCMHVRMPEPTHLMVEGRLVTSPTRVELVYEEGELSGMEGSVTSVGFDRNAPGLVSMMRTGAVETALVFEQGKRHISVYDTPISSFQVCVRTMRVDNRLLTDGVIQLDYLVEIHGAQAEHCRMTISVRNAEDPNKIFSNIL